MNIQPGLQESDKTDRSAEHVKALPLGAVPLQNRAAQLIAPRLPSVQSLEKRRLQCYLALMIGDIVAILCAYPLGSTLHYQGAAIP